MAYYTVTVEACSLEPGKMGDTLETVFTSRHRSPAEAGRRLASIIANRTPFARSVRRSVHAGRDGAVAGRYIVVTPEGHRWSLRQLRDWLITA